MVICRSSVAYIIFDSSRRLPAPHPELTASRPRNVVRPCSTVSRDPHGFVRLLQVLHVGVTSVEHLEEAVDAVDVSLSDSDVEYLEEPYEPVRISGHS